MRDSIPYKFPDGTTVDLGCPDQPRKEPEISQTVLKILIRSQQVQLELSALCHQLLGQLAEAEAAKAGQFAAEQQRKDHLNPAVRR